MQILNSCVSSYNGLNHATGYLWPRSESKHMCMSMTCVKMKGGGQTTFNMYFLVSIVSFGSTEMKYQFKKFLKC